MKISGKFKYETPDGKDPMVVFIPSRKELLSEATLKSPHRFNEAISSVRPLPHSINIQSCSVVRSPVLFENGAKAAERGRWRGHKSAAGA